MDRKNSFGFIFGFTFALSALFSCGPHSLENQLWAGPTSLQEPSVASQKQMMAKKNPEKIKFKDSVASNTEAPNGVADLSFIDTRGKQLAVSDYLGKKNLVIVFTAGFHKMICPFCTTQTSRLIANYEKFKRLDAEVLVVYPGDTKHLAQFIEAARTTDKEQLADVPFPIVLDKDFAATNFFKIRGQQAHPSTYIINKSGEICLAYVGAEMSADRPSVKAMLKRIEQENAH